MIVRATLLLMLGAHAVHAVAASDAIHWQTKWSDQVFAQAAKEHRFVLLDLHAVWCHWCHVMDEQTYTDSRVRKLVGDRYVAVSVDADSDPDLTSRYGNWGWPATIVLAADGTEIVKRRGYIAPDQMASLLQAIIDDPSPGPSIVASSEVQLSGSAHLNKAQRAALLRVYDELYDNAHGGWGTVHKFVDAPTMEYAFTQSDSNNTAATKRVRQTLDANLHLIDPVWGGVYQYSDAEDWLSPHFEKLMSFQADNLRLYSESYVHWQDPRYLQAAQAVYRYMTTHLAAPDGGFYVSQDADVSSEMTGHDFYAKNDAARRALGMPRVDTHEYARETGWAIRSLCKFHDVTGDDAALQTAGRAARWAIAQRSLSGGGFRHDAVDRGGPFLDDTLSMTQAFIALYRSSGEREWLEHATAGLGFIESQFRDPQAGYVTARAPAGATGVFRQPVLLPEQNAALARVAVLISHYTGNDRYRKQAEHGMKYLIGYAQANDRELRAEILLADHELATSPIHITVVGGKHDPAAQQLHAAAVRYPAEYLQVDWWDRAEGPLPNPEIQYPKLERPAAFVCTATACSTPVFDAGAIQTAVRNALTP
jgi:uncharacterized protein